MEAAMLMPLQHPNLTRLVGFCPPAAGQPAAMVLEFATRGSVFDVVHKNKVCPYHVSLIPPLPHINQPIDLSPVAGSVAMDDPGPHSLGTAGGGGYGILSLTHPASRNPSRLEVRVLRHGLDIGIGGLQSINLPTTNRWENVLLAPDPDRVAGTTADPPRFGHVPDESAMLPGGAVYIGESGDRWCARGGLERATRAAAEGEALRAGATPLCAVGEMARVLCVSPSLSHNHHHHFKLVIFFDQTQL